MHISELLTNMGLSAQRTLENVDPWVVAIVAVPLLIAGFIWWIKAQKEEDEPAMPSWAPPRMSNEEIGRSSYIDNPPATPPISNGKGEPTAPVIHESLNPNAAWDVDDEADTGVYENPADSDEDITELSLDEAGVVAEEDEEVPSTPAPRLSGEDLLAAWEAEDDSPGSSVENPLGLIHPRGE